MVTQASRSAVRRTIRPYYTEEEEFRNTHARLNLAASLRFYRQRDSQLKVVGWGKVLYYVQQRALHLQAWADLDTYDLPFRACLTSSKSSKSVWAKFYLVRVDIFHILIL
jgi:hypothetical protein